MSTQPVIQILAPMDDVDLHDFASFLDDADRAAFWEQIHAERAK